MTNLALDSQNRLARAIGVAGVLAAGLLLAPHSLHAQTLTTLYNFCSQTNCTDGQAPFAGLVQGTDGNFYGTTHDGGAVSSYGTVFKITPGGTLTTLYTFCLQSGCADGEWPTAPLTQGGDGNFYGTTYLGGANGEGTVFEVTPTGTLTTLYSFCSLIDCTDGAVLEAGLVQGSDGNFYGTTYGGGANFTESRSPGTVFEITPSGTLTTLYNFCAQTNCTDGEHPSPLGVALVLGSDGNFYGTTQAGGAKNDGTVFEVTPAGTLTTLYSFCSQTDCTDGALPEGGLVQGSDGNFYGTTYQGGANGYDYGTVFKITPSGTLTTLYSFCSQTDCTDGEDPVAGVVQGSDGNFYGTTDGGGDHGAGTLFKVTSSGTFTTLYSFCSLSACADGASPEGALVQGSDGNLYGTTTEDGANFAGTVFRLILSGPAVTFSSPSLNFGSVPMGTQSAAMLVTLTNSGNANLTLGTVTVSGANYSDFNITSNTCSGQTITPNNACTVSVAFTPSLPLGESAVLKFPDNGPGSLQTLGLSGTGITATVSLSPSSLTFSNQIVETTSSSQPITLSNTGSSALTITNIGTQGNFGQTNNCPATLAASGSCAINVTFTPATTGQLSGYLTVTYNSGSITGAQIAAGLTGTGVTSGPPPAPVVNLSPAMLLFPQQLNGTTSDTQGVLYFNSGNAQLTLNNLQIVGPNSSDFSIAAGSACAVNSSLNQNASSPPLPTESSSALTTTLASYASQLLTDTQSAAAKVPLVVQQAQSISSQLQQAAASTGLGNTGNTGSSGSTDAATLSPTTAGVILQGVAMSQAGSASAAANAAISAANAATNAASSATSIANEAAAAAAAAALSAEESILLSECAIDLSRTQTYYSPFGGISPQALFFGYQSIGTSSAQPLTYWNLAGACGVVNSMMGQSATISSITITPSSGTPAGDFSETDNCTSAPVAPAATCTISVNFAPSTTQTESATLTISGAGALPVTLTGTGFSPASPPDCSPSASSPTVTPNPVSFVNPTLGQFQTLTVANTPCNQLFVTSLNVSGADPAAFNGYFTGILLGGFLLPGETGQLGVQFEGASPSPSQPETATLNIGTSVNGVAGTVSVPLSASVTAPYAQFSASELDFGSEASGATSAPQTLTLANTGANATGPLTIYSANISSSSAFPFTLACTQGGVVTQEPSAIPFPLTLNVGDSCAWTISYTNSGTSSVQSGLLSIDDNAVQSNLTSSNLGTLTGGQAGAEYVQQVCLAQVAGGCDQIPSAPELFASNGLGSTISDPTQDMTTLLTNFYFLAAQSSQAAGQAGQSAQNVAQFSTAAANANTNSSTFGGMASPAACSIGVQFTPSAAGTRNATLELFDNSSAGIEIIPLSGTGAAAPSVASQFVPSSSTVFFKTPVCWLCSSGESVAIPAGRALRSSPIRSELQQNSGGSATTQSLVLTNNGTASGSLNLSILGSGDFTESDNCSAAIPPGQTCTANVSFTPVQSGTRNGELVNTDASGNVTLLAPLVGSGTAVTVSPAAASFGNQMVGTTGGTQTITLSSPAGNPQPLNISALTLSGDGTSAAAPGDFSLTPASTCSASTSLSAGASCTVVVSFTPSAEGTRDAVLLLSDNGGASPQSITLTGTGIEAIAGLSPSSLNFSPQVVGTGSAQTVTLSNTGNEALTITGMTASGGFSLASNCGSTLMPAGNCAVAVTFKPLGPGTYTGTLSIADNGPGSPQTVALSGTAVVFTVGPNPPVIEPPPTTPQPVEPGNPPTASGGGASAPKGAPGREIIPSHSNLIPLAPATTITAAPATVSSAPALKFSSLKVTFPAQAVGTSSGVQTITVINSSVAPLVISGISASQDFSQTNNCGESVAAGDSCAIKVSFKPTATGVRSGMLTIQEGAPGSTQAIPLSGAGKPADP